MGCNNYMKQKVAKYVRRVACYLLCIKNIIRGGVVDVQLNYLPRFKTFYTNKTI